ncbi:hypothetical protein BH10ACI3_BH10ACI3_26870 [soil metagenome]
MKRTISLAVVWLFVITTGILLGGSIFEGAVLTPMWSHNLPESVRQWQHSGAQGPFFAVATPLFGLFSVALLALSFGMPRRQKMWSFVAGALGVAVIIMTFTFFLPILHQTEVNQGAGLSGEEITRLVTQFKTWQWGRWAVIVVSFLSGLRALSLSEAAEQ